MPYPRGLILYFCFKNAVCPPHPPMVCVVLLMTVLSSTMQMLLAMIYYMSCNNFIPHT